MHFDCTNTTLALKHFKMLNVSIPMRPGCDNHLKDARILDWVMRRYFLYTNIRYNNAELFNARLHAGRHSNLARTCTQSSGAQGCTGRSMRPVQIAVWHDVIRDRTGTVGEGAKDAWTSKGKPLNLRKYLGRNEIFHIACGGLATDETRDLRTIRHRTYHIDILDQPQLNAVTLCTHIS